METNTYNKLQVSLHWVSAILIAFSLIMGSLVLVHAQGDARITALRVHLIVGGLIGLVMLGRLAVRLLTVQPSPLGQSGRLRTLATVVHAVLYAAALGMVGSGIGLAIQSHLLAILLSGDAAELPKEFADFAPRIVHGLFAKLLIALIATHVAGALYHQTRHMGGTFRRMWFG